MGKKVKILCKESKKIDVSDHYFDYKKGEIIIKPAVELASLSTEKQKEYVLNKIGRNSAEKDDYEYLECDDGHVHKYYMHELTDAIVKTLQDGD